MRIKYRKFDNVRFVSKICCMMWNFLNVIVIIISRLLGRLMILNRMWKFVIILLKIMFEKDFVNS